MRNVLDIINGDESDVIELIRNQVTEGQFLEFKRELPSKENSGRHEFCADVSAFANASGGILLIGVQQDDEGRASEILPIATSSDEEILRLFNILRDGIEPRLAGVDIKAISMPGGCIIVVRTAQSWHGPHRVKTNQHFYFREGPRKRELQVPEIKRLFNRSEAYAQQVRDFRAERISRIVRGAAPVNLRPGGILVLHLIPTDAFLGELSIDPAVYHRQQSQNTATRNLPLLDGLGCYKLLNIDGALELSDLHLPHDYSLLFRNGFFETVQVFDNSDGNGKLYLPMTRVENACIKLVGNFRRELKRFGIGLEVSAMIAIINAERLLIPAKAEQYSPNRRLGSFDRDTIIVPDVLIPADDPLANSLKPMFDMLWQAAGYVGSCNYDESGNRLRNI